MKRRRLYIALFSLLLLLMLTLRYAGTFLVRTDDKAKGEVMVILMGSIPDRVLEAADLYREGFAPRVLIVEEGMGPSEILRERGATLISNSTQCRSIASELGIPADSITLLPGGAQSTAMEADIVSEYLRNHPEVDTLLLVTSPSHTRRAAMVFRKAFRKHGLEITIIACPSRYNAYEGRGWYKRKEDIQKVVYEYIKLTAFMMVEQFK